MPDLAHCVRQRIERIRDPRVRGDMMAARTLTLKLLALVEGNVVSGADLVQLCATCGGCHGAPATTRSGHHLSWSHSRGWVAASVSTYAVGVDVEVNDENWGRSPSMDRLISSVMTDGEEEEIRSSEDPSRLFMMAWTTKEALVKAGALDVGRFRETKVLNGSGQVREQVLGFFVDVRKAADYTLAVASAQPSSRLRPVDV